MNTEISTNRDEERQLAPAGGADLARMRALLDRPLPRDELDANTALVAARTEARSGRMRSVLVFSVGDEVLALEADATHRVVLASVIRRVPHRSNLVFAGLANVAGELTPVANIATALGVKSRAQQSHFIVIGAVGARWAFGADRVEGVRRVDELRVVVAPTTVRNAAAGCTKSIVPIEIGGTERLVAVLDAVKLSALFARSLS